MINKTILIGCGGTGSYLAPPLARLLKAFKFAGELIFADGDSYEPSNLDRQSFNLDLLGENKAIAQAKRLQCEIEDFQCSVIDDYLSEEDVNEYVTDGTLVINCADNNAIRKFVEDRVDTLDNAVHICCGNELRHGQVQISCKEGGKRTTRSIYEYAPIFKEGSGDRSKMSCQELAELEGGGQLITANFFAAALALGYVANIIRNDYTTHKLYNDTVVFDSISNNTKSTPRDWTVPEEPMAQPALEASSV